MDQDESGRVSPDSSGVEALMDKYPHLRECSEASQGTVELSRLRRTVEAVLQATGGGPPPSLVACPMCDYGILWTTDMKRDTVTAHCTKCGIEYTTPLAPFKRHPYRTRYTMDQFDREIVERERREYEQKLREKKMKVKPYGLDDAGQVLQRPKKLKMKKKKTVW